MNSIEAMSPPKRVHRSRWRGVARVLPGSILFLVAVAATNPVWAAASQQGERPEFSLLIVSYLFLLGVSQAGVVFSAICRLVGAQWSKPYYRLAELSTMAFAPFAIIGFLLIYYYSRSELFYWLAPSSGEHLSAWLDSQWLLIRNLFGLLLFYGLSAVYVAKALRPDRTAGSDAAGTDHRTVERQLYLMSPWVLICFVISNTLIAWDFAMMIIPHWHSTVFPIHFWFGNVYAATAAMIAIPALIGRSATTNFRFETPHIRHLSMLLSGFMLLWLYLFWAQFFVIWFGNLPAETQPLWRQMYGHYAPYFWTMMACCFFIPLVALIFSIINRSMLALCVIGVGINLGIWINKYLMVVPVYTPDDRPLDHLLDLALSVGLLGAFVIVLWLLARRFPVLSSWEISLGSESRD